MSNLAIGHIFIYKEVGAGRYQPHFIILCDKIVRQLPTKAYRGQI
jgi:hypothetical protein